jgi:hypothetical protein
MTDNKHFITDTYGKKYVFSLNEVQNGTVINIDCEINNNSEFLTYGCKLSTDDAKLSKRIIASILETHNFKYELIHYKDEKKLTFTISNDLLSTPDTLTFTMNDESKKLDDDEARKLMLKLYREIDILKNPVYIKIPMPTYDGKFTDSTFNKQFMNMLFKYLMDNTKDFKEICKTDDMKFDTNVCTIKNDIFWCSFSEKKLSNCLLIKKYIKYLVANSYKICLYNSLLNNLIDSENEYLLCSHQLDAACNDCKIRVKKCNNYDCYYNYAQSTSTNGQNFQQSVCTNIQSTFNFGRTRIENSYNINDIESRSFDCKSMKAYDIVFMEILKYYELVLNYCSNTGYHLINMNNEFFNDMIKCTYDISKKYRFKIVLLNQVGDIYYNAHDNSVANIDYKHVLYASNKMKIKCSFGEKISFFGEKISSIEKQFFICKEEILL